MTHSLYKIQDQKIVGSRGLLTPAAKSYISRIKRYPHTTHWTTNLSEKQRNYPEDVANIPKLSGPDKGTRPPARVGDDDSETGVAVKTRPKTKKPSMYKVLMLNDDYTPMEFVIHVLERFFSMSQQEATQIMLHVHQRGVGVCGVFTYEVSETKVSQVMDLARQHQHPLQCTIEKDGDD